MKIAVYIVGQWRGTAYQCSENLKKIFDKFDTDYYIHIYPFYEGKNVNLIQYDVKDTPIVEHENYIHTEQDLENIKNTYNNVVSFEVESYDTIKDVKNIHSTFYQYYCAYKANEVRKIYETNNGIKYDAVIKIRPDIIFSDYAINNFIEKIEYIKNNPLAIFSFYNIRQRDMKLDNYYHWDFYTISNTFGIDCMTEWVGEILKKGNEPEIFSSNSIIINNLIVNPVDETKMQPGPALMREGYKYNNLIEDFYNQMNLYENNIHNPKYTLRLINDYIYDHNVSSIHSELIEYFKSINLENKKSEFVNRGLNPGWNKFLTENELKELADLIKNKVNENNIHAKDN
jgi:hypothetical protein